MRVRTAIERLEKFDPDAELKLHGVFGEEALFVCALNKDDSCVWLEAESDVDMKAEISERLSHLTEDNAMEIYTAMLEQGITVDMLSKYEFFDEADAMENFIEEKRKNALMVLKNQAPDILMSKLLRALK